MPSSSLSPAKPAFASTVVLLSVSVTLFWTAIYYSFATMLPLWEAEEGWDKTTLTVLFGGAVILSALIAPAVGRLIDAGRAPVLVALGSIWGALVLGLAPFAPNVWFFALLWVSLGLSQATVLYEPTFAMVTRAYGAKARRVITLVTLVGALAGTLAFPLVHFVSEIGGWHLASWTLAGMIVFIAGPLHVLVAARLERLAKTRQDEAPKPEAPSAQRPTDAADLAASARKRNLVLLTGAFALAGASHGLIVNHILPILASFGFTDDVAVLAAATIGPMQMIARLTVLGTEHKLSAKTITTLSFASLAISALCLLGSAALPLLLVGFGLLQGYGYGSVSIMRPVLLRESVGEAAFGQRSGQTARVYIAAIAVAPLIGSLLWTFGGYPLALCVAALASFGAMALVGAMKDA